MSSKIIAEQSLNPSASQTVRSTRQIERQSFAQFVHRILNPIASMRLTVLLLVMAVLVTWIATLQQTRFDIWEVKQQHFPKLFAFVPIQTMFPPAWFPNLQTLPAASGFYIPSGFSLMIAMLINLAMAHLLRMRVQAQGTRLVGGIAAALAGLGVTWLVIFNGQNPDGFQAQPPISYQMMWVVMQVLMLGLATALAAACWTIPRSRMAEKIVAGGIAAVVVSVLALVWRLGDHGFLGDSAMRILWQLIQGSVAALAMLAGCQLLFRRKGGIVLLHLGIAMLMANEIYVTTTNVEQKMSIFEGESSSHTVDIRSIELVVADIANPEKHELTVVPGSLFISGKRISHPDLPFDFECLKYISNSDVVEAGSRENPADAGIGQRFMAEVKQITAGTDMDQIADMGAAYIRLLDKQSGKSLGVHLVSQIIYEEGIFDEVNVAGKTLILGLRFEHHYKPYSLKLLDVSQVNYVGTQTAKSYESKLLLTDEERGLSDVHQRVYMNNPMRFRDETFYQSGVNRLRDGREATVLQIVKNRGWMIPYVACMFVVIGLIFQFGNTLLGFLEKRRRQEQDGVAAATKKIASGGEIEIGLRTGKLLSPVPDNRPTRWTLAMTIFGLALGYVVWAGFKASSEVVEKDGKRLDRFGAIPLAYQGRIQPLESLARNTARRLGNRETVAVVGGKKVPAIRWMSDMVYDPASDGKYQIIRIDDPYLLAAIGLRAREGFKYTLEEINGCRDALQALVDKIAPRDEKTWTTNDKRVMELQEKLSIVGAIRYSMNDPNFRYAPDDIVNRLTESNRLNDSASLPRIMPGDGADKNWSSLVEAYNLRWLQEMANTHMAGDTKELAEALFGEYLAKPIREEMIKQEIVERLLRDQSLLKEIQDQNGETDPVKLRKQILSRWDAFPKEIYKSLSAEVAAEMEPVLQAQLTATQTKFNAIVEGFVKQNGGQDNLFRPLSIAAERLTELSTAYLDAEASRFNSLVESHLKSTAEEHLEKSSRVGIATELYYNRFAPFYLAAILYLMSIFSTIGSWVGYYKQFSRAAFSLNCLALAVQVAGIVLRIVISGRPPVTTLYSTFLFVPAMGVIILMIVERVTKLGLGTLIASLSTFTALLWAWTISIADGDTFTVLVAVLDTQFWLSTHVLCISTGYAATMVAGLLGVGYIVGGVLLPVISEEKMKQLSVSIYGITCFALLCSFFGTVLGGLWADDSWGRFWGWDPKENGALMIVLWNAVLLHARWAGMVKQQGIAVLAVLGCVVTIWSWEGVNQLGEGLHSYGFSSDRLFYVAIFAAINLVIAGAGCIPWGRLKTAVR